VELEAPMLGVDLEKIKNLRSSGQSYTHHATDNIEADFNDEGNTTSQQHWQERAMAAEKKGKKRKGDRGAHYLATLRFTDLLPVAATISGTTIHDQPSKKSKKSLGKLAKGSLEPERAAPLKKTRADDDVNKAPSTFAPPKFNSEPAREIKPRKRAVDFLSDGEDDEKKADKPETSPATNSPAVNQEKPLKKKSKKKSKSTGTVKPIPNPDAHGVKAEIGENKKFSKAEKNGKKSLATTDNAPEAPFDDEGESEGDMTSALIKGFESSGDEDVSGDEGLRPGEVVPTIPDSKQIKRRLRKMKKTTTEPEGPGTVYIG
jgi:nucleolar protein 15